jgi:hypothetical protein
MATEKNIEIRGSGGGSFRRITRTYEFLGDDFTLTFVRIDPSIEHAIRVENGEKDFAGTLLINKDET